MGKKLLQPLILAASLAALSSGCVSFNSTPQPNQQSWSDRLSKTISDGTAKVAAVVSPKPDPNITPATPGTDTNKPKTAVLVAMAHAKEQADQIDEAETKYKQALGADPDCLPALVGYAHLEDRRGNFETATKLYRRALKKHGKDPSVHNDLGLCFHRRGMLNEASKSLQTAVELKGESKLYRNNLAAVYVEQGKNKEALEQLVKAHGEAVGNYNLAYLLTQKHDNKAALVHFRKAAEKDPSLDAARQWIAKLAPGNVPTGPSMPTNDGPALADARANSHLPSSQSGTIAAQQAPVVNVMTAPATNPGVSVAPSVSAAPSNDPRYAVQSERTPAVARGVQFPQARRGGAPADAMPPLPE